MIIKLLRRILPVFTLIGLVALIISPTSQEPNLAQMSSDDACAVTPAHISGQARFVIGGQARFVIGGQSGDQATDIPAGEIVSAAWGQQILEGAAHGNEPVLLLVVDDFDTPISHGRWVAQTIYDNLQVINTIASERGLPTPDITVDFIDIANLPIAAGPNFTAGALATVIQNRINDYEDTLAGEPVNVIVNMSFAFIPCSEPGIGFDFSNFISNWDSQFTGLTNSKGATSGAVCDEKEEDGEGEGEGEGKEDRDECPLDGEAGYTNYSLQEEIINNDGSLEDLTDLLTNQNYESLMAPLLSLFNSYTQQWDDWLNGNNSARPARPPHVVAVASSGNYGDILQADGLPRDPFAPARWSSVMAVSAPSAFNPELPSTRLDFAQEGNVATVGAWFDFTGPLLPGFYPTPGTNRFIPVAWSDYPGDGRYRAGTSFSTPLVATSLALQATQPDAYKLCDTFAGALPLSSGDADLWDSLNIAQGISCPLLNNQAQSGGDLALTIANYPTEIPLGGTFTYDLIVSVENRAYISGLEVNHMLPNTDDASAQIIDISRGLYSPDSGTWYIGAVREFDYFGNPDKAVMTVSVKVARNTSANSLTLNAATEIADTNGENNNDSVEITITPPVLPNEITRISPMDGAIVSTATVPLQWEEDVIATWYHVELSSTSGQTFDRWLEGAAVCVTEVCEVTPPDMLSGTYTWTMTGATTAGLGPANDTTFTVVLPTVQRLYPADEATLIGTDGLWQSFSFQALEDAEWYGIWIGDLDGNQALYEWYPAEDFGSYTGICDASSGICTIPRDIWLMNGNYQWWMTYWGPNVQSHPVYWHQSLFDVGFAAPATINNRQPVGQVSDATTLGWNHDPNVLWYHVWLGPEDYSGTELLAWYDARDICDIEVCTINLADKGATLSAGTYEWSMEVWGPEGYQTWNTNGPENFEIID